MLNTVHIGDGGSREDAARDLTSETGTKIIEIRQIVI